MSARGSVADYDVHVGGKLEDGYAIETTFERKVRAKPSARAWARDSFEEFYARRDPVFMDVDTLLGCGSICRAVTCCPCITLAQLSERTRPRLCGLLAALLFLLFLASAVLSGLAAGEADSGKALIAIALGLIALFGVIATFVVFSVRRHVRKKEDIEAGDACGCCEGGMEDLCCAVWCNPCTQCQLLRQLGLSEAGGDGAAYSLCSETGEPKGEAAPLAAAGAPTNYARYK